MRRPFPTLLAATVAALAMSVAAGCGSDEVTIDKSKAEDLARKIAGSGSVPVKKVTCPDGEKAKNGATFDCALVYEDGATGTITLHQTDDKGGVRTSGQDIKIEGQ